MLKVGSILHGTYRIDSYLSSGGFGNTYVATNIEFDERVAIKEFFMKGVTQRDDNQTTISVSNSENTNSFLEQKEKFKKEARRIRQLNNPHIVRVHDLFEENGTAYYVMDYVDGENLAGRLKRTGKPMTENEVNQILPQILDALKSIHNAGIWHLDLKPANIMVDKAGNVKLIDFGASKQLNAQKGGATTSTAISYTNGYAPREQMEQNYDKFGPWTDIYALGATLYNLLTNKRPPLPTDIDDDMSEDKHVALPFPEGVGSLRILVLQMMKTNRLQRPQNVDAIITLSETEETKQIPISQSITTNEDVQGTLLQFNQSDNSIESEETILESHRRECTTNSRKQIISEMERDANEGWVGAQIDLGYYYQTEGKNWEMAFYWYEKAAKQGNPIALLNLGYCYLNGQGVQQDYSKAFRCYQKAAESGNASAIGSVGFFYERGYGVTRNLVLAVDNYRKAAELGDASAQNNLGVCYQNGTGVQRNLDEARKWYSMAAEQGSIEAQSALQSLNQQLYEKEKNPQNQKTEHSEAYNPFNSSFYVTWGITIAVAIITFVILLNNDSDWLKEKPFLDLSWDAIILTSICLITYYVVGNISGYED